MKHSGLKVLMISSDRKIFEQNSAVTTRMLDYGQIFEDLRIIVFSLSSEDFIDFKLTDNVWVYPTNSSSKFFYVIDAIKIARNILKEIFFGQTIISVQDPFESGIAGVIIKKKTKLPLQVQIHTDLFSCHFFDSSLLNWLRFHLSKYTLKRANGIRVVSKKIENDLIHFAKIKPEKITVLPIYVDIRKITDDPVSVNLHIKYPQWKKIILVASRLEKEKNVALAIMALARALPQIPEVGMVIVGSGREEESLKSKVKSLKLGNNVVFESWQQNLISYYKTADLFLNTSNFEGYGMALVEAAAAGCPILTTEVGIAGEFFKHGESALLCPVGDTLCLKNKLITFFSNSSISKNLISGVREIITEFSYPKEEYLRKYRESFDNILK